MIGKKLGPYDILEEIGKGGMATVFRAHQASIERDVAVKIIRARIADDPIASQRFQREARLIARLEHPHILPVYDFDGSHDPPYIVMRYLEGGTLKEVIQQGRLPLPEVTYLLRQVCGAVDYAHRQGIIHRDLKPSNILIDRDGNAFVTDFGIARLTADMGERQITETGAIIGTPDYMSPEQITGSSMVDHRADIYSLGIIAYEMLAGQLPFPMVDSVAMMYHHLNEIPTPLTEVVPDLPTSVDEVVDDVLEKDPELRFDSAVAFAEALIKTLGGTVSSTPETLRKAAGTSILRRVDARIGDTDSKATPPEQQKQVTVVYVNTAEFSEIAEMEAPDPVATRFKLWEQLEKVIDEHGGYVENRTGDTLLALWGVKTVHEDDAEQAVRCALAMQGVMADILAELIPEDDEALPMQIGIHSGLALLTYNADSSMYNSSGTTVNTASRLERSSPAGGILISQDTYNNTRGVFLVEGLAPIRFRGSKEAIQVFLVKGTKARAFRSSVQSVEGIKTRTIGRDAELKQLTEAMEIAMEDHETQIITIVGEAGVGKSRLTFELEEWEEKLSTDFWYFPVHSSSQIMNQPFGLMREIFTYRFQIQDSDLLDVVQEKFETGIARFMGDDSAELAHLMAYLVGFTFPKSPYLKDRDPQQLNQQGQQAVIEFFVAASQLVEGADDSTMSGLWMRLENIHWADDRSLDLINQLVEEYPELPLVVTSTARPTLYERRPNWGSGQDFHQRIDLKPLSKLDSRKLVREILQKVEDIPKDLRDLIVDRAEGNPFYMEELVKILVEDHVILKGDDIWHVEMDRLANVRVPTTLTGLVQARIDSLLVDERVTLQRAAVVGRVFWESTLRAMQAADKIAVDVSRALAVLMERELVQLREETTFAGEQEYIFKSTMLHDVVYNSILKRQLRDYHYEVAEWLSDHSKGRSEYDLLIAEHYEIAGEDIEAARYLFKTGQQAQQVSAYDEALGFYERGQKLIEGQMDDDARRIQVMIGNQWGAILEEMGRFSEGENLLNDNLVIARELANQELIMEALNILGTTTFRQGRAKDSMAYLEEALTIARNLGHQLGIVHALMWIGVNYYPWLDDFDMALKFLDDAQTMAENMGDQRTIARINNMLGENLRYQGEYQQAIEHYEKALSIYKEINNSFGIVLVTANLGHAMGHLGEDAKAYARYQETMLICMKQGALFGNGMQESIAGITKLKVNAGENNRAMELLGMVFNYPDLGEETKIITNPVLERLKQELGDEVVDAGMERGKSLDWETEIQKLLDEMEGE